MTGDQSSVGPFICFYHQTILSAEDIHEPQLVPLSRKYGVEPSTVGEVTFMYGFLLSCDIELTVSR